MIQCMHCGTQNRDGSKFCSNCGARLVQRSGLVCPMCGTPNTVENVFCLKCGARLVPLTAAPATEKPPTPIKGISLPAKPTEPSAPAEAELPKPTPAEPSEELAQRRAPEPVSPPAPTPETPAPEREPVPAEETSDWLARLRAAPPVEEEVAPTAPTPRTEEVEITAEDLPDWLRPTSAPTAPEVAPTPTEEPPSWITRVREEEGAAPPPAPVPADEIPDWLKGETAAPTVEELAGLKPVAPAPEVAPPVPATEEEIPDWLKAFKPEEMPADEARGRLVSPGEELVESLEAAAPVSPAAEPTWLTEAPREVSEEEFLPDWLRTPIAGKPEPTEAAPVGEPGAPMPDWIAALKPTEQPVPGIFAGGPVETSGPLAGLRGVLPLATAIVEPHEPPKPAPPSPFKEGARLFESILAAPALAPTPAAPTARRVWTLRPLIYILMVLAVLIPFFVPDLAISSLRTFGTPAADLYDTIQSLQPNSIVVLSFDYEPGSTGEMDLQANALVRHLISKRVRIVTLSTLETGPQVAQRVLDDAARATGNYNYGINYLNLGYVAGQEAGLRQLAITGFTPATRDYFKNQTLDKYPDFANLRSWRSVALLIELAGAPEPLQKWMEQVQPRAGIKIAAGVSAAVEPRARAYRDAKQLTGFVGGLLGAAQYEALSNQRGLAIISAGAQSTAQIVLIGLIILGNLVYWFTRKQGKAK